MCRHLQEFTSLSLYANVRNCFAVSSLLEVKAWHGGEDGKTIFTWKQSAVICLSRESEVPPHIYASCLLNIGCDTIQFGIPHSQMTVLSLRPWLMGKSVKAELRYAQLDLCLQMKNHLRWISFLHHRSNSYSASTYYKFICKNFSHNFILLAS